MERISKENYYLDIAETVLERATCLRRIYGAIIVKNDEIISTGYNGAPRGRANCVDMGYCSREAMNVPSGQRYELCRSVHAEMNAIISRLKALYPDAMCSLDYEKDYELLFSVRLAAQCTDARVNLVTPALFARFPRLEDYAVATPEEVGEYIRSCGFWRAKARDIVACAQQLLARFGGRVPDNMDDLLSLPGVGRKTANLILGDIYGQEGYVCDTHCIRITGRLGITDGSKDPVKVEQQLRRCLPPEESNNFCHRMVLHGRAVCTARAPQCESCTLRDLCDTGTPTEQS